MVRRRIEPRKPVSVPFETLAGPQRTFEREKPIKCGGCDQWFASPQAQALHFREQHPNSTCNMIGVDLRSVTTPICQHPRCDKHLSASKASRGKRYCSEECRRLAADVQAPDNQRECRVCKEKAYGRSLCRSCRNRVRYYGSPWVKKTRRGVYVHIFTGKILSPTSVCKLSGAWQTQKRDVYAGRQNAVCDG